MPPILLSFCTFYFYFPSIIFLSTFNLSLSLTLYLLFFFCLFDYCIFFFFFFCTFYLFYLSLFIPLLLPSFLLFLPSFKHRMLSGILPLRSSHFLLSTLQLPFCSRSNLSFYPIFYHVCVFFFRPPSFIFLFTSLSNLSLPPLT